MGFGGDDYPPWGVTLRQFESLRPGMTEDQVSVILGGRGTPISESSIGGSETVMYTWDGYGRAGANMNATFRNGRLIGKAQFGLE